MAPKTYDFAGWATKNDIRCTDGRTIRKGAFKECDGAVVPLVWNHQHNEVENVLGHALLEYRDDGIYSYGIFNDTPSGEAGKALVRHGDVTSLSIYANQLKQNGGDVVHGVIREVSLVLAGANSGARIETVIAHSDFSDEEAIIYSGVDDLFEDGSDDGDAVEHSNDSAEAEKAEGGEGKGMADDKERTIKDVVDSMTEEQKKVLYYLVGEAAKGETNKDSDEGEEEMKHNVFDQDEQVQDSYLSHSEIEAIFKDGKKYGSLKESFEAHTDGGTLTHASSVEESTGTATYGIDSIDWLFPEARQLNNTPAFIQRNTEWVAKVMNVAHHSPMSRIKSRFANITADEARARGYVKGKKKIEEVFTLLKRSTTPQTIYKKQKLDRDDIIDITDFDVVAWLKGEMRMMLNEEIARAVLIGDGRLSSSDDKISEEHVRPIATDDDLFTIKAPVSVQASATEDDLAKEFIRTAIKARKNYKGSGNPVLFTTEDMLTAMLLLEDGIGHSLYKSEAELATKLRVREIVTVEVMEGQKLNYGSGEDAISNADLLGIIVNMADYNIGADKGGAVSMFEDFDIDYNQEKYLIETRISGALTVPYSAISLYKKVA